ncbi:MAG: PAS domain S-box protein [Bacteroidales bacterium]|nr:MAG: PAS domain S-box protein [Bacteroidales bacterium]
MRPAKLFFVFLLLFLLSENSTAQKQGLELIDSLKLDLVNASNDTNKVAKLCRIAFEHHRFDTDLGIKYAEQALRIADSLSWKKGIAYACNALGVNYIIKGSYPEALYYFQKSLAKYTEIGDSRMVATLCNNLGLIYNGQNDYIKAIEYFNKSLAINERLKNQRGLSLNYGNLALVFSNQKQYEKSNEYYLKALKIDQAMNNKDAISRNLSNIASMKSVTKDYCESLDYGLKALSISEEIKSNYNQGFCNKSVGETYYGVAIDSSIALNSCSHFKPNKNENLRAAIMYLTRSIEFFSKVNDLRSISDANLIISKAYESLADSKNALIYFKHYSNNKDSVIARDNKEKLAKIENKFEIDIQAKQLEIKSLEVKNKNNQIFFQILVSLIVVITISIISFILYKKQKFQKAINLELNTKNLALEKSEEKLRVLFETMPIGFYISTLDGHYIDVNPALVKMLGYDSREELLNVSIPNDVYLNAFERDDIIQRNNDFVNSVEQYQLKTKDGRVIWIEDNAMYIKDSKGNVIYNEGFCRDITDRKLADEILRENEEKYRYMFDNNPQPMFIYDPETLAFLEVNQSMEHIYGYTHEEFLNTTLKVFHLPEDNEKLMVDIERAKRSSNPRGEWRHIKKNGDIIFVEIRSHSLTYRGKSARHVLVHDVTERKRVEDALRLSEEKFRRLITNIRDIVYSVDVVTKEFKYLSPSFERITGYSEDDIKRMGGREAFLTFAVTKEKFTEWDNNLQKLTDLNNGVNLEHETWWLCKDGSYKCLEDHWTPVFENGKLVSTDGVLIDVTDRKHAESARLESEEKLKDLFENMMNGFYRSTPEGYFVDANPAFVKMLGYESKEELLKVYIPIDLYVNPIERDEFSHTDANNSFEIYRLKAKDGRVIWIEDNARYLKDENGKIIYHEGICQDITDRKQAEMALRVSEEKFRLLFETMPNGYYRSTKEGHYVDVNPAFVKIMGYASREELLKVYIPTDVYVKPEEREQFIRQNSEFEDELVTFRQKTKDGRIIWLEENARYIKDENGEVIFYEGICRDITERKLADTALRESEEKFKNLFENMPNGYYRSTHDGYYVDANPAFIKMLGYESKEELLKVYIPTDLYVEPSEREIVIDFVNNPNNFEVYRQKTKDGRIIWLEDNARYIKNEKGEILFHEGICRDITDRRRAEEALRESEEKLNTLFNTMTEMVAIYELVLNEQGVAINYRITDCNDTFTQITSIKKEEAIGKLATEIYKTTHAPYLEEFAKVAQTGENFSYSTYFEPMDKHFMVSVVSPKKNLFATITTDITEIKQIQEAMTSKKNELENYLYVASHDLRSPMVNIQGFSQRLQRQSDSIQGILAECKLDEETKVKLGSIAHDGIPKTLNFILSNVTKMDTLINGLLQISRTGRIKMNIQKIDINHLFKTIIANNNFQISEISAQIIVNDLPNCYGDENQLNQLFSNIIGNALKYRDKKRQMTIEISGHIHFNKVIFSIQDTGIGIPPKYLDKIWDVFFRVDTNSTESGEGIGLSLVKRIIDKHKGKIWVESTEGVGSTFYIELQKNVFSE